MVVMFSWACYTNSLNLVFSSGKQIFKVLPRAVRRILPNSVCEVENIPCVAHDTTSVTVSNGLKMLRELSDVDTVYVVLRPFFSPPPPVWQEVGLQIPQCVPQSHKIPSEEVKSQNCKGQSPQVNTSP